jgi:regulation of enolase protein 1 (concanavalin A-like superfamily)
MRTTVQRMTWLNEPEWGWDGDAFWVQTRPDSDCWQRTHYGFQRDNAHALVGPVPREFRLRARFRFEPNSQYDQCGLIVRAGPECWFKCSVEFEPGPASHLGSVVTNGGYSDWATQEVSSATRCMCYEVVGRDLDLVASCSVDGLNFRQMRVAHLSATGPLVAGIYGCSPTGPGFRFRVETLEME